MIAESLLHDLADLEAWGWTFLILIVFAADWLAGTIGKGVLWRPVQRRLRRIRLDREERDMLTLWLRMVMMAAVAFPIPSQHLRELIGGGLVIGLCLDDMLAGEDGGNWRRRRRAAANRLRWLMRLPAPASSV